MAKATPIYIQIHNQIRKMIEQEVWKIGERIPSERDLAIQFSVSRMTLRQAVQTLVDEGILERKVGSGSYHVKPASVSEARNLKLKTEDMVLRMERIRYADEIPICFEVATIPYYLVESLGKQEITKSLYKVLESEQGITVMRAEQTVSAMRASEKIAEYLSIKRGESILQLKQISYSKENLPFEYVRTQYVGERFEFYLEKDLR